MIQNKFLKHYSDRFFIGFLLILFIVDFIVNVNINYGDKSLSRLSGYYKLIIEVLLLIGLFNFKRIKYILLFAGVFIIGQLYSREIFEEFFSFNSLLKGNFYYFNRYIYVFIFIQAAFLISQDGFRKIKQLFKSIMSFNALVMLVGWGFSINLLKSFPFTERFGYDGFFTKSGDAAYLYMIFLAQLYVEFFETKTLKKGIMLLVMALISILTGEEDTLIIPNIIMPAFGL